MKTALNGEAQYEMVFYDVLEPKSTLPLNEFVGKDIRLSFEGNIHCVVTGKKIPKVFG